MGPSDGPDGFFVGRMALVVIVAATLLLVAGGLLVALTGVQ